MDTNTPETERDLQADAARCLANAEGGLLVLWQPGRPRCQELSEQGKNCHGAADVWALPGHDQCDRSWACDYCSATWRDSRRSRYSSKHEWTWQAKS